MFDNAVFFMTNKQQLLFVIALIFFVLILVIMAPSNNLSLSDLILMFGVLLFPLIMIAIYLITEIKKEKKKD
jgi:hypothetical protein